MASQSAPTVTSLPSAGVDMHTNPRGITDPWYQYRGPLNGKFLELIGSGKAVYETLGGGDAFLQELRREPGDK